MVRVAPQKGMAYLWLLLLVFLMGLGAGKGLEVYATALQRQKEADLLYIGKQYQQAIGLYYLNSPPGRRSYPPRLEDLLLDPRSPAKKRYLRRLYADPMTGRPFVPVPAVEGGIQGVRSSSSLKPLGRQYGPTLEGDQMIRYRDWDFLYVPLDVLPLRR